MAIRFTCACGQQLQAAEEHAGCTIRCPRCGRDSTVPDPRQAVRPAEVSPPAGSSSDAPTVSAAEEQPIEPAADRFRPARRARSRPRDDEAWDDKAGPTETQTSGKAKAALVLGFLSFCTTILTGIPAIIFGILGLRDVNQSRGRLTGSGLAITGIVLGAIGSLLVGPAMVGILLGLLLPATQKVRNAAELAKSSNNLKQIGLGLHSYYDKIGQLPENAAILSKDGRPLLSWRVAILPFIEYEFLYRQFHLDESWDSPHNKTLISQMPKVYAHPAAGPGEFQERLTYYRAISGPGTAFLTRSGRPGNFPNITDGTSNTILIVETADPVIWTKPDDLVYDPTGPLPRLGGHFGNRCTILMCDGFVRTIDLSKVSEKTLRAAITADRGEMLDPDW
jgi:type II secretory pathway pseudopilin PulG